MSKEDAAQVPEGPGDGDPEPAGAEPGQVLSRRAVLRLLLPWAVLVASIITGWAGSYALIRPVLGQPVKVKGAPAEAGRRVEAHVEGPAGVEWISSEQAILTWRVTNSGEATWAVDLYRFDPETPGAPVIPLPAALQPGESATLRAVVNPPPGTGDWETAWNLFGARGKVVGGRLTASLSRRPDSSAGERSGGREEIGSVRLRWSRLFSTMLQGARVKTDASFFERPAVPRLDPLGWRHVRLRSALCPCPVPGPAVA